MALETALAALAEQHFGEGLNAAHLLRHSWLHRQRARIVAFDELAVLQKSLTNPNLHGKTKRTLPFELFSGLVVSIRISSSSKSPSGLRA